MRLAQRLQVRDEIMELVVTDLGFWESGHRSQTGRVCRRIMNPGSGLFFGAGASAASPPVRNTLRGRVTERVMSTRHLRLALLQFAARESCC